MLIAFSKFPESSVIQTNNNQANTLRILPCPLFSDASNLVYNIFGLNCSNSIFSLLVSGSSLSNPTFTPLSEWLFKYTHLSPSRSCLRGNHWHGPKEIGRCEYKFTNKAVYHNIICNSEKRGVPGWLSQSGQLLISAQVVNLGLWDQGQCWASPSARSLLQILTPSSTAPPPLACTRSLSLK